MKKTILPFSIGLYFLLGIPTISYAADIPQSLSLPHAVEQALIHNPKLKAARSKLGISDAQIITAGTRINPSIISDNGIAEKTYRLGIEQTFELGGKRKRRVELSKAQRESVLAEINTQVLDIRSDVRKAYLELYNTQERHKTYQQILKVTDDLLQITKKREQAGDVSKFDVLQTEIANVNTNNELQTNLISLNQAKNRLASLLNQPLADTATLEKPELLGRDSLLAPTASQQNVDSLIEEAFKNRPEIKHDMQAIAVTKAERALAIANRIPNLKLTAGPDYVYDGTDKTFNIFVMGNLELPLFNRQQGKIAEAEASGQQLGDELSATKNTIRLEVMNAHTAYTLNHQRVLRYENQLLPYAQEVVKKSQQAFEEGKTSILTAIAAQKAFSNTKLSYLMALLDYQNAISDLERAIGTGL